MAIGSGIGSQLGIATETTFNNAVTVSTFYEFNNESINYNKNIADHLGITQRTVEFHRANILDHDFTQIGVGVSVGTGDAAQLARFLPGENERIGRLIKAANIKPD